MATEKLRDPEIALAYVEGHSKHPDFGYAIAALHKSLVARLNALEQRREQCGRDFVGFQHFLNTLESLEHDLNTAQQERNALAERVAELEKGYSGELVYYEDEDGTPKPLTLKLGRVVELER